MQRTDSVTASGMLSIILSSDAQASRQSLRRIKALTSALSTFMSHFVSFFSTSTSLSENKASMHRDDAGSEYCKLSAARMSGGEGKRRVSVPSWKLLRHGRTTNVHYSRKLHGTHDNLSEEAVSPSLLRKFHLSTSLPSSLNRRSLSHA